MYKIRYSNRFKKDFKQIVKNPNFDMNKFDGVLGFLIEEKKLGIEYQDHKLKGDFKDCNECHIQPDVLLIYKKDKKNLIINLLRIGSHSKLF